MDENQKTQYENADNMQPRPERDKHVEQLTAAVKDSRSHWQKQFKRIRRDQAFAKGMQWPGGYDDPRYVVNITHRHIQQRTAALYAKNPKTVSRVKERMDYQLWDGKVETITAAQQRVEQSLLTGGLPSEMDVAMLMEFSQHKERQKMLERVGETLTRVYDYYCSEQVRPFKKQMKRTVRRTITSGLAYVKLDYQRIMRQSPSIERELADVTRQMAQAERLSRELAEGQFTQEDPEADQLRAQLNALQAQAEIIVREGLVFDFPRVTSIIPDKQVTCLDGFTGADFVAQEYALSVGRIKEIYDVDVKSSFTEYSPLRGADWLEKGAYAEGTDPLSMSADQDLACVWEIYHKKDGVVYTICDGYKNFLIEPSVPNIYLERFWPFFTLMFNEVDSDEEVFPPSDVELIRHAQLEMNRAREGLREHRQYNKPRTYVRKGSLDEEDKTTLQAAPPHAVVELKAMADTQRIEDLLQPHTGSPLDPNLYTTNEAFEDVLRAVGTQEANLGGTSGSTATESSIAESSRLSSLQSNVDDLDDFMTEIARSAGQVLLQEVTAESVKRIAGTGAVWPELSREEIISEVYLEIQAGSSGRPNQAQQLQNIERMAPYLIQIPGLKPEWLAEEVLHRMDDKLDLTDAFDPALPSITMMNSMQQPSTGDPETDPNAQGSEGGQNQAQPEESEGDTPGPGRPPMDPNLKAVAV